MSAGKGKIAAGKFRFECQRLDREKGRLNNCPSNRPAQATENLALFWRDLSETQTAT
jgi:hypothetical protein